MQISCSAAGVGSVSGNGTEGTDGAAEPTKHGTAKGLHHPEPPGSQLLSAKKCSQNSCIGFVRAVGSPKCIWGF